MPVNRMNRDEFYAAMAPNDDARLRKILWTLYWRGNAQVRARIEDELRPPDQPKVKPKKELPDPVAVLDEVTTFAELARDGAYMAGDRRARAGAARPLGIGLRLDPAGLRSGAGKGDSPGRSARPAAHYAR